jgi:hypothetical protein
MVLSWENIQQFSRSFVSVTVKAVREKKEAVSLTLEVMRVPIETVRVLQNP